MSDKYVKYVVGEAKGFYSSFEKTEVVTIRDAMLEYVELACNSTSHIFMVGVLADGMCEHIHAMEAGVGKKFV